MPSFAHTCRGLAALTATAALTGALAACSGTTAQNDSADGTLTVLASTNVWADIAQSVGGEHTTVEAIINDPSADPHSYEYAPRDVATVEDADLVIFNGGGYDEFIDSILDAISTTPATINAYEIHTGAHGEGADEHADEHAEEAGGEHADEAAHDEESGHAHDHGSSNEHVWYDLHTVSEVAEHIADELAALAPEHADDFRLNAASLIEQLNSLEGRTDELRAAHDGTPVAQTEPLAGYLLDAAGLVDVAPTAFTSAIENGTDPSAAVTAEFRDLLETNDAQVLVYNTQSSSPVTEQLRATAESQQTPVVEVTETLPEGVGYVQWMNEAIDNLAAALDNR